MTRFDRAQRQHDNQVLDDYHESDDDVTDLRAYRELEELLPEDVDNFGDLIYSYREGLKREENAKRRYEYRILELGAVVSLLENKKKKPKEALEEAKKQVASEKMNHCNAVEDARGGLERKYEHAAEKQMKEIEKLKAAVKISLMHIQAGVPQFIKRYRFDFERLLGSGDPIDYKDHYIDDLAEIEKLKTEVKRLHAYAGKLLGTDPAVATVDGCVDAAVTYMAQRRTDIEHLKVERMSSSYVRMLQSLRRQLTAAEVRIRQLEAEAGEEIPYHDGHSEALDDRQRLNSIHLSAMAWETQTKLFLDEIKHQSETWGNNKTALPVRVHPEKPTVCSEAEGGRRALIIWEDDDDA